MTSTSSNTYGPLPSRKEVKQIRRELCWGSLCAKCRTREGIKRCSKCKTVYCSQECQREDWLRHKGICAQYSESDPDITKLTDSIISNSLLRRYIEVLIILKLELLQKPRTAEPFQAQIIIGFEPSSIFDFFDLFKPSAVIDASPLQGMLQIHQIFPESVDLGNLSKIGAFPEDSPLEKRRMDARLSGLDALPFGVIQFIYGCDRKSAINCMQLLIQEESMDLARQANEIEVPVYFQVAKTVKKPLSEWSCIESINALIRQDVKNQWLLRMDMTQSHKQMIKDTSASMLAGSSTAADDKSCGFRRALSIKLVHESIYPAYMDAVLRDFEPI